MASITAVVDPPTASVQVTVDARLVVDTFTRVVAAGFGSADFGGAYTTSGGAAADYSVTGTRGQFTMTSVNVSRSVFIDGPTLESDQTISLFPGVVALGAPILMGLIARRTAATDFYRAEVQFGLAGAANLLLRKVVGGVTTILATVPMDFTYGAGSQVLLRFRLTDSLLQAKAWLSTVAEPTAWAASVFDNSLITAGSTGIRVNLEMGNTNVLNVVLQVDDYTVCEPFDRIRRVYPDGSTALLRGSPFNLSGCFGVFYDTEMPLNTSVTYRATTATGLDTVTSNSVIVEAGDDGWLRDPNRPANDIKMDNCTVHSPQCLSTDQNIFFQRLEGEQYDSASGVFEIVDAARGLTVAQTRKDQKSTLGIVSRKLSDITRIRTLLSPGSPLLLQLPTRYGWGITSWGSDYIQVYDDTAQRLGPDMGKPYRNWTMPFTVQNAPGDSTSGNTGGGVLAPIGFRYADSTATGRTYAQSTALGRTYLTRTQHPTF